MVEKNRKLQNQFEAEASTSSHGGSGSVKPLFDGVSIFVDGFTVTAKFKCVARVVAALPWQAEDFLSPLGTYRIRLTLEDPTARIHALLYGEDGEKFFGGYPSVDALTRKLSKLLGLTVSDNGKQINYAPRNPPWVQFCLKSYYLSKTEVW